jgi:hypothetical protein
VAERWHSNLSCVWQHWDRHLEIDTQEESEPQKQLKPKMVRHELELGAGEHDVIAIAAFAFNRVAFNAAARIAGLLL